jgi:hypothetical protein
MARKSTRWTEKQEGPGTYVYRLSSWTAFPRFIEQEFLDYRDFIWRGQCASKWSLEPTLDRILRLKGTPLDIAARQAHLERFKYATRGRRGHNPPRIELDNEWWALGQHFGLATPLLDWTESPFVAAYFAFTALANEHDPRRAIWALDRNLVAERSKEIAGGAPGGSRPPIVEFVRPMTDDNSRLVSQGGLFTRGPDAVTINDWVRANFPKDGDHVVLARIEIPNSDRDLCLRSLNRMNINHLSLFRDLYGAAKYCNFDITLKDY